ncbi:MAG: hypothetical protein V3T14_14070 [Myxococcota bacterium]
MRSPTESRARKLEIALRDAGLADQVQIGMPSPALPARGAHEVARRPGRPASPGNPERPAERPALDPFVFSREGWGGQLIEVAGALSSGRTTLACRMAARITGRGQLAGWVDLPDALDPRSLHRAGADLGSVMWARPRGITEAFRCAELLLRTGFALVVVDLEGASPSKLGIPPVWARLLRRVREGRATCLLLVPERVAGSFPTLGLWTERRRVFFEGKLFEGIETRATVVRDRNGPIGAELPFEAWRRPSGPSASAR